MKRFNVLIAGLLVAGACACGHDDVSTTTTNSAVVPIERMTDVYRPTAELDLGGPAAMGGETTVSPATTPRNTGALPQNAAAPVGTGGFVPGPLDTGSSFVPGPLDTARGFGRAPVNPGRAFTPAPIDTTFRGPGVVDNRPTGGPMRPSGASNPNTTSGADPRR